MAFFGCNKCDEISQNNNCDLIFNQAHLLYFDYSDPVPRYYIEKYFIQNNKITFTNRKKLCSELLNDKKYHFRIHNNKNYIYIVIIPLDIRRRHKFNAIMTNYYHY